MAEDAHTQDLSEDTLSGRDPDAHQLSEDAPAPFASPFAIAVPDDEAIEGDEPESRLLLETPAPANPAPASASPAGYLPLFVAPQPVTFEPKVIEPDDDEDDDEDEDDEAVDAGSLVANGEVPAGDDERHAEEEES